MSVERDIRYDLIARLCPNATGAELKSVATEVSSWPNHYRVIAELTKTTRRACLRSVREERWPASETFWMPSKRSFDKEPSFPVRHCTRNTTRIPVHGNVTMYMMTRSPFALSSCCALDVAPTGRLQQ